MEPSAWVSASYGLGGGSAHSSLPKPCLNSASPPDVDECASAEEPVCTGVQEVCENTEGSYRCVCASGHVRRDGHCVEDKPPGMA